jgi:hypothetical protein
LCWRWFLKNGQGYRKVALSFSLEKPATGKPIPIATAETPVEPNQASLAPYPSIKSRRGLNPALACSAIFGERMLSKKHRETNITMNGRMSPNAMSGRLAKSPAIVGCYVRIPLQTTLG